MDHDSLAGRLLAALDDLERLEIGRFVDLFADDGLIEFPFGPSLDVVRGRGAIAERMGAISRLAAFRFVERPTIVTASVGEPCLFEAVIDLIGQDDAIIRILQIVVVDDDGTGVTRWRDYRRQTELNG